MLPKFNPNKITIIYLNYTSEEVGAMSVLVPKVDSLGLTSKKVGDGITKATGDLKGLRTTMKLTIQNREAQIE